MLDSELDKKEECRNITWAAMIEELRNVSLRTEGVGDRQWVYQTCSQFGYCKFIVLSGAFSVYCKHYNFIHNLSVCLLTFYWQHKISRYDYNHYMNI